MKTKEEVINEAWKEFGLTDFSKVDKNGWLPIEEEIIRNTYEEYEFEFLEIYGYNSECVGWFHYRPKSLAGIEDNNGWIKIESEEDLPKLMLTETNVNHQMYDACYYKGNNFLLSSINLTASNLIDGFKNGNWTHYKKYEQSKTPLY